MDLAPNSTNSMEHLKGCYENSRFVELVEITHFAIRYTYPLAFFFFPSSPSRGASSSRDASSSDLLPWAPALPIITASGWPEIRRDVELGSSSTASSVFLLQSTQKKP